MKLNFQAIIIEEKQNSNENVRTMEFFEKELFYQKNFFIKKTCTKSVFSEIFIEKAR